MNTTYDIIRDPTTGEPLMSVCTRGPSTDDDKNALAALQLYRQRERTPEQQAWLDSFLAPHEHCDDPQCSNPAHLPDRDDTMWGAAEELASWVEDDTRQRRRWE